MTNKLHCNSVPRACGDEPEKMNDKERMEGVFPAHAGMNRNEIKLFISRDGVPRACGDEP